MARMACSSSGRMKIPTVSQPVDSGPIHWKGKPAGRVTPAGKRAPGRMQRSTPRSSSAWATASNRHSKRRSLPRWRKPERPGLRIATATWDRAGALCCD
eukprot:513290-Pyramimonas_sp.AAC.1